MNTNELYMFVSLLKRIKTISHLALNLIHYANKHLKSIKCATQLKLAGITRQIRPYDLRELLLV